MSTRLIHLIVLGYFLNPLIAIAQFKGVIPYHQTGIKSAPEHAYTIREADSLIATDPQNPILYDMRGEILFRSGKVKEAYYDFTKAITLNDKEPAYYQHRGILSWSLKMPAEAVLDYDKAIVLTSDRDTFRYSLIGLRGNAKMMQRDFKGAYEDFMTCYRFDSTSAATIGRIGSVLDELGRGEEALAYLKRAFQLAPDDKSFGVNLGYQLMMVGKYEEALFYLNKALALDPENAYALNNRGYVYFKLNNLQAALKDVTQSLALFPENSYAFKNGALIYFA